MDYIAFRNLAELGYSEDEIKAMAAEAIVIDGPNDEGEMFERAGLPFDYFPAPFRTTGRQPSQITVRCRRTFR